MNTKKEEGREWIWCSDCKKKNDPDAHLCWNCALRYEEPVKRKK